MLTDAELQARIDEFQAGVARVIALAGGEGDPGPQAAADAIVTGLVILGQVVLDLRRIANAVETIADRQL